MADLQFPRAHKIGKHSRARVPKPGARLAESSLFAAKKSGTAATSFPRREESAPPFLQHSVRIITANGMGLLKT